MIFQTTLILEKEINPKKTKQLGVNIGYQLTGQ